MGNIIKNKNMKYQISVDGCDDSTVVEIELTKEEKEFMDKFIKLVNKTSTYGCMPTMSIKNIK
jgi:hypothetical protein